ncbi:uncharacterized protein MELLADRAFT_95817 [Melampsora larici-populina 98AG31]|uniref:Uncharacterized protein n=1 Tax=Melampsora larici-populina (strain 98AG31 / pathotype 3-4-7) TaxID=747676 RepID=F4RDC2_MELLP|nr:uncharacterized protein MELLADRAFT_95817 [Melampsora larici-populina 98AG31]EGG09374.1 hypothetical protein MELLADRAFT_95817 [Melampsora larici-populina 98AG31]
MTSRMHPASKPEVFDPSAPGVGKQMMLDWLRINFPLIPVNGQLSKSKIAETVREQQPEFFPDPTSSSPPQRFDQSGTSSMNNPEEAKKDSSSSTTSMPHPSAVSSSSKTVKKDLGAHPPPSSVARLAKQSVSNETDKNSNKRSATANGTIGVFYNNRVPLRLKCNSKIKQDDVEVSDDVHKVELSGSTPQFISSHLLGPEGAQSFISPDLIPLQHMNKSSFRRIPPKSPCLKTQTNDLVDVGPQSAVIPSVTKVKFHPDLIEFLDLDLFETENTETEPVIPCLTNSGKQRSGVDIFLMEQHRNDKILGLETALSELKTKIEMTAKSDIDTKKAQQQGTSRHHLFAIISKLTPPADDLLQGLKADVAHLKKKSRTIDQLNDKVASMEQELIHLKEKLDEALSELQKQEEIITKMT